MSQPVRAVFWDLGGVLLRTFDHERRRGWESRLGLSEGELARLVFDGPTSRESMLGRASAAEVWDSVGRQLGIPPEDLTRLRLDFFADDRIDEGLMSFVRGLRRRVRVGLISNAWADVRPLLDSPWAIADAFDPLVISAEVGMVKPHEPIFRLALDQAGVGPSEAAFVDDLPENVEAAIRLGMHGVLFRSTEQAQAEVEALLREETTGD